jgi:hypothetical protein
MIILYHSIQIKVFNLLSIHPNLEVWFMEIKIKKFKFTCITPVIGVNAINKKIWYKIGVIIWKR